MPLLQVRDFPQDLYELLSLRAEEENRSITQQTIYMLKMMLNNNIELSDIKKKQERQQFLNELAEFSKQFEGKNIPSAVDFIREDRDDSSFRR